MRHITILCGTLALIFTACTPAPKTTGYYVGNKDQALIEIMPEGKARLIEARMNKSYMTEMQAGSEAGVYTLSSDQLPENLTLTLRWKEDKSGFSIEADGDAIQFTPAPEVTEAKLNGIWYGEDIETDPNNPEEKIWESYWIYKRENGKYNASGIDIDHDAEGYYVWESSGTYKIRDGVIYDETEEGETFSYMIDSVENGVFKVIDMEEPDFVYEEKKVSEAKLPSAPEGYEELE